MREFDLIVIGSGAGLMVLEAGMAKGLRCAIVEREKFGGTCLTKGCIPSKMLVYPADFIREAQDSKKFGVTVSVPVADWGTISRRVWEQIDFHRKIRESLMQVPALAVFEGTASFLDRERILVQGEREEVIRGRQIIIATGARSFVPKVEGLEETGYLTSEKFFGTGYPDAPWKSLLILGSGAISAEFAHIFSAMGTQVTLIARSDRILKQEEEEVALFVQDRFRRDGIRVLTDTTVLSAGKAGNRKQVKVSNRVTGEVELLEAEEILVAMGTESTVDLLHPERAGVEIDEKGWVVTNEYLETSQPGIYALGDINGRFQLRHKANHEALVLSHNLFSGEARKAANYDFVPWAVFTYPQVGHAGATEAQLRQQGIPYQAIISRYSEVVAGMAMGHRRRDPDDGFVKMLVGRDKKILGVHMVGPQAAALVQPYVYMMIDAPAGSYEHVTDAMIIHPSLSELAGWTFEKLAPDPGSAGP